MDACFNSNRNYSLLKFSELVRVAVVVGETPKHWSRTLEQPLLDITKAFVAYVADTMV